MLIVDQMKLLEDQRRSLEKEGQESLTHAVSTYPQIVPSDQDESTVMTTQLARRPVYVRGRGCNNSVGIPEGAGIGQSNLPPKRSTSFKFNVWRDVAVEQEQAVSFLQSAFDQLTADSAAQQNSAVQVKYLLSTLPTPKAQTRY